MNDNINANLVCERFPVLVDGIGSNKMTKWRTLGYDTGVFCSAYFEAILTIFSTNFHFSFARIDGNRWRWPIDIHVEGIFNSADCILTIVGDTCEVRRKSIVSLFWMSVSFRELRDFPSYFRHIDCNQGECYRVLWCLPQFNRTMKL